MERYFRYADNNKNVVGYNNAFTSDIICEAVDFENVPYTEKQSDFEKNKIYVSGNINTSYNEYSVAVSLRFQKENIRCQVIKG